MTQNSHICTFCCRPAVVYYVISGLNVKTMEGYLAIIFEVASSNSFRDIPTKIISWRRRRRRTSTIALSENSFAFRLIILEIMDILVVLPLSFEINLQHFHLVAQQLSLRRSTAWWLRSAGCQCCIRLLRLARGLRARHDRTLSWNRWSYDRVCVFQFSKDIYSFMFVVKPYLLLAPCSTFSFGMDVRVKLGDYRSNRSRDIRAALFVIDERRRRTTSDVISGMAVVSGGEDVRAKQMWWF